MSTIENALFYINHIVKFFFSYFASISIKELGDWLRFAWQSPSQIFFLGCRGAALTQSRSDSGVYTGLLLCKPYRPRFCSLFRFLK